MTDEALNAIIESETRRYELRTNLAGFVAPDIYGLTMPVRTEEQTARLTALAAEHAAFDTLRPIEPKPITNLAAFVAPDAWGQR